ncbi:hypothetical protein NC652_019933 [Populus alba x Populus x berolinensis]|nr:hypothetical protein NC652_019933 [Populus alba x Populus x berolinensis]
MGVEKQAYQTRNWSQTNCWSKRDRSLHWFWEKIVISHRSFGAPRIQGKSLLHFKIGQGSVIKGWDEGVMGMQVGEVARLRLNYCWQRHGTQCFCGLQKNLTSVSLPCLSIRIDIV